MWVLRGHPRHQGSTYTSSTLASPIRVLIFTDTCATPPDRAATTAEVVSITGVSCHFDVAIATPAGISIFPTTMLTPTKPVPAMKNRSDGYAASTQVVGD